MEQSSLQKEWDYLLQKVLQNCPQMPILDINFIVKITQSFCRLDHFKAKEKYVSIQEMHYLVKMSK